MAESTREQVHTPRGAGLRRYLNPLRALWNLFSHREVAWQLAQRDVAQRYRSSSLGLLWSILNPLLLLAIYTFVFAVVFKARWGDDQAESRGEFALAMFCGMIVFNVFAEVLNRAATLITGQPNYVKKLVFPLEVLVLSALLSSLVTLLMNALVWLAGWGLVMHAWPHPTAAWLPVLILPVCLTTLGLAWLTAALGVFVRDLQHVVALAVQILFFATPIFYSAQRVPYPYRYALELNPLTHAIEAVRAALMWGSAPNWPAFGVSLGASLVIALLGYAFFMKSKRAFADVI